MDMTLDQVFDSLSQHVVRGRITFIEGTPALNPRNGSTLKLVEPGRSGGGLTLASFHLESRQEWAAPYTRGMPVVTHIVDEGDPANAPAAAIRAGRELLERFVPSRQGRPIVAIALTRYRAPFFARFIKQGQLTEDAKIANLNDPILLSMWDAATGEALWISDRHDELLERAGIPGLGLGLQGKSEAAPMSMAGTARSRRPKQAEQPAARRQQPHLREAPMTPLAAPAPAHVSVPSAPKRRAEAPRAIAAPKRDPEGTDGLEPNELALLDDLRNYGTSDDIALGLAEMHMVDPDRALWILRTHVNVPAAKLAPARTRSGFVKPISESEDELEPDTRGAKGKPASAKSYKPPKQVPTSPAPRPAGASASSDGRMAKAFMLADEEDIIEWMVDALNEKGGGLAGRDLLDAVRLPRNAATADGGTLEAAYKRFLLCLKKAMDSAIILSQGNANARRYFLPEELKKGKTPASGRKPAAGMQRTVRR